MTLTDIANLIAEYREAKARQQLIREEMVRVAVEVLGLPQEEAIKKSDRMESILDGYLIGQGMRQEWRKPE
jgi:hypothetical protein